jgi:hypothetical protein
MSSDDPLHEPQSELWKVLLARYPNPTPEQQEDLRRFVGQGGVQNGLDHLIAALEAKGYADGQR